MSEFFDQAYACLMQTDADAKCAAVARLVECLPRDDSALGEGIPLPVPTPGRPPKPELVPPQEVAPRGLGTRTGHAAMIHAFAHIEFNAINLALDATYRFRGLPRDYYADWLRVAAEEAYHFALLRDHLRTLGFDYGDFPAHSGLWDMAQKTAHDALVRMALVPRVLEARGLDVTPGLREKLVRAGDAAGAKILEIVERDEIGHVAIGNRWYRYLCEQRGLAPLATFEKLMREYDAPPVRPPLHEAARRAAGFTEEELAWLSGELGR